MPPALGRLMRRIQADMADEIEITLPDDRRIQVPAGTTVRELAGRIGAGLGKACVGGIVNGEVVDQRTALTADASVRILTSRDPEALSILRHSAAHLLAMAAKRVRPGVRLGFGPAVEDGFFYDFDVDVPFTEDDLARIEEEMKALSAEDLPYERYEVGKEEARSILEGMGEELKIEHLVDIPDSVVSFYRNRDFQDLCEGPHVRSTGEIRAFRLLRTSSAYWKGDSANRPLSRIYGTAFFSKEDLEEHLERIEEAKRRDHRRLGTELDLFSFHPEAPGMAFWHEKGAILYQTLLDYYREQHELRGYRIVRTPLVMSEDLWRRSGHWDHYQKNMFFIETAEGRHAVKPMNCPGHNLIYRTGLRSYRDLPLRLTEPGIVHRNELSGVVGGLTRVRSFAIDDAHVYCMPEQIRDEILAVMDLVFETYRTFGFSDFEVELSTRPATGSIGSDEMWEQATGGLRAALEHRGVPYRVSPGEGAFYGPKIDFHLMDSLRRRWQCGTIQADFAMPERFDLEYVAADGSRQRPVMLHRAVFGSVERFIAILVEHYAGKFPAWLSPVQAMVLSITEKQEEYAGEVHRRLQEAGVRARLDVRSEKVGRKIREATLAKIPYLLVAGEREAADRTLSVRNRAGEQSTEALESFVERIWSEIRDRR